jgi:hypothetical protein
VENLAVSNIQFGSGIHGELPNISITTKSTVHMMPFNNLAIPGNVTVSDGSTLSIFGNVSCSNLLILGGTLDLTGEFSANNTVIIEPYINLPELILRPNSVLIATDIYVLRNSTLISYGATIKGNVHNNGTVTSSLGSTIVGYFMQSRFGVLDAIELTSSSIPVFYVQSTYIDGWFLYSTNITTNQQVKLKILKSASKIRGYFYRTVPMGALPYNYAMEYTSNEVYILLNVTHSDPWWVWVLSGVCVMLSLVVLFSVCIYCKYGHRDGFKRI